MNLHIVAVFAAFLFCASCAQKGTPEDNTSEHETAGVMVTPDRSINVNIADVVEPEQYPLRPTYDLMESEIPINGERVIVRQIVVIFVNAEDDYDFSFQETEQGPALVLTRANKGLIALPRTVVNPELKELTPVVAYVLKYQSGKIDKWMPTSFQLPTATVPTKLPDEGIAAT